MRRRRCQVKGTIKRRIESEERRINSEVYLYLIFNYKSVWVVVIKCEEMETSRKEKKTSKCSIHHSYIMLLSLHHT
jgi:hypothetical protein